MMLKTIIARLIAGGAKTALKSVTLLRTSGMYRLLLITFFVLIPHYSYLMSGDIIGFLTSIGFAIGTADKIIYESLILFLTTPDFSMRIHAIIAIIQAIAIIGWYVYAWFWVGNKFVYADVYIFATGAVVFVLLFIIGHMEPGTFETPFRGFITLIENLDKILDWETIKNGIKEDEIRTWYLDQTEGVSAEDWGNKTQNETQH